MFEAPSTRVVTEKAVAGLNGPRHYSGNGHWAGRLGNVYAATRKWDVLSLSRHLTFDVSDGHSEPVKTTPNRRVDK